MADARRVPSRWEIEPPDVTRKDGGFVRLGLKTLLNQWLDQPGSNHGVLLTVSPLDGQVAADRAGGIRLVVLYGFRP